jgi:hypothetical protein
MAGKVAVALSTISWEGERVGVSVSPLGNEQADETNKSKNTSKYGQ